MTSVAAEITNLLQAKFSPSYIEVSDESHLHHVPKGAQSHFKVTLVSEYFDGISRIARHRAVNECLAERLAGTIHALGLHLYTPAQWEARQQNIPESPKCAGSH